MNTMITDTYNSAASQTIVFEHMKKEIEALLIRDDVPSILVEERLNELECFVSRLQAGGN